MYEGIYGELKKAIEEKNVTEVQNLIAKTNISELMSDINSISNLIISSNLSGVYNILIDKLTVQFNEEATDNNQREFFAAIAGYHKKIMHEMMEFKANSYEDISLHEDISLIGYVDKDLKALVSDKVLDALEAYYR